MPRTLIITGNAAPGTTVVAAAAAHHSAATDQRTLLLSFATAASLAAVLGSAVDREPRAVAPGLEACALDPLHELERHWERERTQLPGQLAALAGDELPTLAGTDVLLGMLRVQELAPHYDAVLVDAGAHEPLIHALALPDGLRWGVRLLFGLDRGPGRSVDSLARAVLPATLLPGDTRERVQQLRIEVEQARAALLDPVGTTAWFVMRPDAPALAEARLAVPALHLDGLAVSALLCGPCLPSSLADGPLAALVAQQQAVLAEATALWPSRAVVPFDAHAPVLPPPLHDLRTSITEHAQASEAPIRFSHDGEAAVVIDMQGLPSGALGLTLTGDELIVRVGPYRRHVLLPDGLRGTTSIRATREGDLLVVRRR